MIKLDCNDLYQEKNQKIKEMLLDCNKGAKLATLRVGEDLGSISYERALKKQCDQVGMKMETYVLDEKSSDLLIRNTVLELNEDKTVNGILLFKPMPGDCDEDEIMELIHINKDVDGCTSLNRNRLFNIDTYRNLPATAVAITQYLKSITQLSGKEVFIINRSYTIGMPLFFMLLKENATVEVGHSKTLDIEEKMSRADIIITAVGRNKIFKPNNLKKDAIIIDMGYSLDENGRASGDIDTESIGNMDVSYMPSIGGIGKITRGVILENVCLNYLGEYNGR